MKRGASLQSLIFCLLNALLLFFGMTTQKSSLRKVSVTNKGQKSESMK